jgi:hypothetical protein
VVDAARVGGIGIWIGVSEEVEIPGSYLGLGYAALSAPGVALGILLRCRVVGRPT